MEKQGCTGELDNDLVLERNGGVFIPIRTESDSTAKAWKIIKCETWTNYNMDMIERFIKLMIEGKVK